LRLDTKGGRHVCVSARKMHKHNLPQAKRQTAVSIVDGRVGNPAQLVSEKSAKKEKKVGSNIP